MQSMSMHPALRRLVFCLLPQGARRSHFTCCSLGDSAGHALQQAQQEAVPDLDKVNQPTAANNTGSKPRAEVGQIDTVLSHMSESRPAFRDTQFRITTNQSDHRTSTTSALGSAAADQLGSSAVRLSDAVRTLRTFSTEGASKYVVGNGPMTMRGVILPGPNEKMYVEQFQIPKPQVGEVLIRTKACGVCHTDLHVIKGEQKFPTPAVLGHEVSGTVLDHGPGTDPATIRRLPVGARVVGAFIMPCGGCFFCTRGQEEICETFFEFNRFGGTLYDGTTRLYTANGGTPISQYSMSGLAEYCVMPASALAVLPEKLPFAESAIMGCAIFTAYGALRNGADLRAGETVAVVGVGGVGGGVVQLAKAFGAKTVIAVDISDEKLRSAKKLGATHVVNGAKENVAEKVREYTAGRGVDVAVEALGKAVTFGQALAAVRGGGRAVMVGIAPTGAMAEVEITRIVRKEIRIIGSYGARTRHDLPDVIDLAAMGKFDVAAPVSRRYTLDNAADAYAALDRGEIDGRAIVLMD